MKLEFGAGPPEAHGLILEAVRRSPRRPSQLASQKIDIAAVKIESPHPVYDLRADQIAQGEGLEAARLTGFRYLIVSDGKPVAAAEVHFDQHGAPFIANINYGRFVQATNDAFRNLQAFPQMREYVYEVRLLRMSAIPIMAVWLKPLDDGRDIVFPLAPVPEGLRAEMPYDPADFLERVRPLVRMRVAKASPRSFP